MNRTTLVPEVVPLAAVLFCTIVYGEPDSKRQPVALVSVSVVVMDSERIIANQTVLIQNGRIRAIAAADTIPISETTLVARRVRHVLALPHAAQQIEGGGELAVPSDFRRRVSRGRIRDSGLGNRIFRERPRGEPRLLDGVSLLARQDDFHVGVYAPVVVRGGVWEAVDDPTVRQPIVGYCQLHGGVMCGQPNNSLNAGLSKAPLAHNDRSTVVLKRAGHHFRRAGRSAVDQHDQVTVGDRVRGGSRELVFYASPRDC